MYISRITFVFVYIFSVAVSDVSNVAAATASAAAVITAVVAASVDSVNAVLSLLNLVVPIKHSFQMVLIDSVAKTNVWKYLSI